MSVYDVIIIGAGPAGATAANLLARAGKPVALLDAAAFPRKAICAGWLNARAEPILKQLHLSPRDVGAVPLDGVTFHSADLEKTATPRFKSPPGFVVDRLVFDHALVQAAAGAGADVLQSTPVIDVMPRERDVEVVTEAQTLRGRTVILASGRDATLIQRIGLARAADRPRHASALAEFSRRTAAPAAAARPPGKPAAKSRRTANPRSSAAGKSPGASATMRVILGLTRSGGFATVVSAPHQVNVAVHMAGDAAQVARALEGLVSRLSAQGLIPAAPHSKSEIGNRNPPRADRPRAEPELHSTHSPAGAALDMDTHVGKHALAIGDAGGFVSAASHEGLYPAMWSAQLAAAVLADALAARNSQDVLMQFETRWRSEMGEYLRVPNTDIHFLLPLIFSNQPMTDRMAAAFFFGENI